VVRYAIVGVYAEPVSSSVCGVLGRDPPVGGRAEILHIIISYIDTEKSMSTSEYAIHNRLSS
jgi:hypothetical protein